MAILSEAMLKQLRERFGEGLEGDVRISLFTQRPSPIIIPGRECGTCNETAELLTDVTSTSDKLELEIHDFYNERDLARDLGIDIIPAFLLKGEAKGTLRYFGIPAGLEFPSLVDDLVDVSRGTTSLSEESLESLGGLSRDVHIRVFVTPT